MGSIEGGLSMLLIAVCVFLKGHQLVPHAHLPEWNPTDAIALGHTTMSIATLLALLVLGQSWEQRCSLAC
jgi:hypothetical protein